MCSEAGETMQEDKNGLNVVSDDVLILTAAKLVQQIDGVVRLSGGITDNLSENIFGITPSGKGIKLTRDDDGIVMDVSIIVAYKVKIPQLAWDIQSSIRKELETITTEKVSEINIHVQGVDLPLGGERK